MMRVSPWSSPACGTSGTDRLYSLRPHRHQQSKSDQQKDDHARHAGALAGEMIDGEPIDGWARESRDLARERIEAEHFGFEAEWDETRHERAARGLCRPDEDAKRQSDWPEPCLAMDKKNGGAKCDRAQERDDDGWLRAHPVVDPSEKSGTQARRRVYRDPEKQHLVEGESHDAGGVDTAENEERVKPVPIDHSRNEKAKYGRPARQILEVGVKPAKPSAHGLRDTRIT